MNDLFRQYMLTQRTDAERDQLRERLLADQELFDQLRDQENEWIDAYAAGKLPAADASLLLEHLTDTGQLHRVPIAAALAKPKAKPKPKNIFPYAFAIAAIIILCFAVLMQTKKEEQKIAAVRPPAAVYALVPGTLRSAAAIPKVQLSPRRDTILQLIYQDTAPAGDCRVAIRSASGETFDDTSETCGAAYHSHTLTFKLPNGRYTAELKTTAGEPIHTYLFDLTNERE